MALSSLLQEEVDEIIRARGKLQDVNATKTEETARAQRLRWQDSGEFERKIQREIAKNIEYKVIIRNFPDSWRSDLKASVSRALRQFGELKSVDIQHDVEARYVVVSFGHYIHAKKAVSMLHQQDVRNDEDKLTDSSAELYVQHYASAMAELWTKREDLIRQKLKIQPHDPFKCLIAEVDHNLQKEEFGFEPVAVHMLPLRWRHEKKRTIILTFDTERDMEEKRVELQSREFKCQRLLTIFPKDVAEQAQKDQAALAKKKKKEEAAAKKRAKKVAAAAAAAAADNTKGKKGTAGVSSEGIQKVAKKTQAEKEVRAMYYLDDVLMGKKPNLPCGQEPCAEVYFKAHGIASSFDDNWEEGIRRKMDPMSCKKIIFCRDAQENRTGGGYVVLDSHQSAQNLIMALNTLDLKLFWSESERFIKGERGPYYSNVIESLKLNEINAKTGCMIELERGSPIRFVVRGASPEILLAAHTELANQITQIHSSLRNMGIVLKNLSPNFQGRKSVELMLIAFSGIKSFENRGEEIFVTLEKPEKTTEAVAHLDGAIHDGQIVKASLLPIVHMEASRPPASKASEYSSKATTISSKSAFVRAKFLSTQASGDVADTLLTSPIRAPSPSSVAAQIHAPKAPVPCGVQWRAPPPTAAARSGLPSSWSPEVVVESRPAPAPVASYGGQWGAAPLAPASLATAGFLHTDPTTTLSSAPSSPSADAGGSKQQPPHRPPIRASATNASFIGGDPPSVYYRNVVPVEPARESPPKPVSPSHPPRRPVEAATRAPRRPPTEKIPPAAAAAAAQGQPSMTPSERGRNPQESAASAKAPESKAAAVSGASEHNNISKGENKNNNNNNNSTSQAEPKRVCSKAFLKILESSKAPDKKQTREESKSTTGSSEQGSSSSWRPVSKAGENRGTVSKADNNDNNKEKQPEKKPEKKPLVLRPRIAVQGNKRQSSPTKKNASSSSSILAAGSSSSSSSSNPGTLKKSKDAGVGAPESKTNPSSPIKAKNKAAPISKNAGPKKPKAVDPKQAQDLLDKAKRLEADNKLEDAKKTYAEALTLLLEIKGKTMDKKEAERLGTLIRANLGVAEAIDKRIKSQAKAKASLAGLTRLRMQRQNQNQENQTQEKGKKRARDEEEGTATEERSPNGGPPARNGYSNRKLARSPSRSRKSRGRSRSRSRGRGGRGR